MRCRCCLFVCHFRKAYVCWVTVSFKPFIIETTEKEREQGKCAREKDVWVKREENAETSLRCLFPIPSLSLSLPFSLSYVRSGRFSRLAPNIVHRSQRTTAWVILTLIVISDYFFIDELLRKYGGGERMTLNHAWLPPETILASEDNKQQQQQQSQAAGWHPLFPRRKRKHASLRMAFPKVSSFFLFSKV